MKSVPLGSRIPLLFLVFALLFITLACVCNASTLTPTVAPIIPTVTQASPYTPEELANAGTHTYTQVTQELTCSATDPSTRDMQFKITLSPGAVKVFPVQTPSGGHVYPWAALNTYVLDSGDNYRITITFSLDGFTLYSEVTQDGGKTYDPCLRYIRTRLN